MGYRHRAEPIDESSVEVGKTKLLNSPGLVQSRIGKVYRRPEYIVQFYYMESSRIS